MDGASMFRRVFHLASPIFLGYYLLPEDLGGGITRTAITFLFLGTAFCVEIARIALGIRLFGMRTYEGQRVSAYAQGAFGLAVGLILVRDPNIVVPVFLGMAWIDPLAAMARKRKWPRVLPGAAYFAVFVGAETVMNAFQLPVRILFAAVATVAALVVEGPRIPQVDDDLLMQVVPMAVLYLLVAALPPSIALL